MKSCSSLSDPICFCIYIPQAEISLWNVPAERFRSCVPNPTLIGFYTYTNSSPCLHSGFNLITLLHRISFPVTSSQFGVYLHFVFPFQTFTLFELITSLSSALHSKRRWKGPRHISDIRGQQDWDPSVREGETGAGMTMPYSRTPPYGVQARQAEQGWGR